MSFGVVGLVEMHIRNCGGGRGGLAMLAFGQSPVGRQG